jgi:outer membrane receptor for ferrienterochelin and colicin
MGSNLTRPATEVVLICGQNYTYKALTPCHASGNRVARITLPVIAGPLTHSQQPGDLTQESLEDPMNIEITSVSKKEQRTSQAPAAVFVIFREDICRSGARDIPDLLRMVPGVNVAQIDTGQ